MRIQSLVFFIGLTILFPGSLHAQEADPVEQVGARARAMYALLEDKNVRHFRVRDDLAPFFVNRQELSTYLILLARDFKNAGVANNNLREAKVTVREVAPDYGYAEVETRLKADWFLFFTRSFERADRWKLVEGEWYVNPPPLRDLDY
jgi:hypothetical protein